MVLLLLVPALPPPRSAFVAVLLLLLLLLLVSPPGSLSSSYPPHHAVGGTGEGGGGRAVASLSSSSTLREPPPDHPVLAIQRQRSSRRRAQEELTDAPSPSTTTTAIPYTTSSNGVIELRKRLLQDYDKMSYPFEHYWNQMGQRTGLPVNLTINFHRVFAVEVTKSSADLIVWVRQVWHDPRLMWDPLQYSNVTTMQFWVDGGIGMGERSEIWTPDLHLWNAAEPLSDSLADAHALVNFDGTVFWARPGHLRPACKFVGLDKFPFDTLTCTIEIGSWGHSGLYLRPVRLEEGFTKGGSQTAGEAYAEFTLDSIACEEYVYPPFIEAPTEDWPVMLYHVQFTRAWQPYARGFLVLQMLLNLIGFATFWLPPQAGERMGLSITALLASVASELVVTEKLPSFGEISWVTQFSLASLLFTALALLENSVVIYLHYHTGSSLVPRYVSWARSFLSGRPRREHEPRCRPGKQDDGSSSGSKQQRRQSCSDQSKTNQLQDGASSGHMSEEVDDRLGGDHVDLNDNGAAAAAVDTTTTMFDNGHHHLNHPKVRKSIEMILGRDADDFKNIKEMNNNARWQWYAKAIDDAARIVYPVTYAIFLAVKFSQTDLS